MHEVSNGDILSAVFPASNHFHGTSQITHAFQEYKRIKVLNKKVTLFKIKDFSHCPSLLCSWLKFYKEVSQSCILLFYCVLQEHNFLRIVYLEFIYILDKIFIKALHYSYSFNLIRSPGLGLKKKKRKKGDSLHNLSAVFTVQYDSIFCTLLQARENLIQFGDFWKESNPDHSHMEKLEDAHFRFCISHYSYIWLLPPFV